MIVDFLLNNEPNVYGYYWIDMLGFTFFQFVKFNCVVSLFPTKKDFTRAETLILEENPNIRKQIQNNVQVSFRKMLLFWGFDYTECGQIVKEKTNIFHKIHWFVEKKHNFIFTDRIIESLRFFGLEREADVLSIIVFHKKIRKEVQIHEC